MIYSHLHHLVIEGTSIESPIQPDPSKFQIKDCWAITDQSIKNALKKMYEFTPNINPNIISVEMPMHDCQVMRATYFMEKSLGTSIYFMKGRKQDGKLWSVTQFNQSDIPDMLKKSGVKIIKSQSNTKLFMNIFGLFTRNRAQLRESVEFSYLLFEGHNYFQQKYFKTQNP